MGTLRLSVFATSSISKDKPNLIMKVAVVIALVAMLAVASAYYPGAYYGYGGLHGGYPHYAGAAAAGYLGYPYGHGYGYGYPYGYGYGYGYGLNKDAADKAAVAPVAEPAAEAAVPVAE